MTRVIRATPASVEVLDLSSEPEEGAGFADRDGTRGARAERERIRRCQLRYARHEVFAGGVEA
jgi:hypothetical protein